MNTTYNENLYAQKIATECINYLNAQVDEINRILECKKTATEKSHEINQLSDEIASLEHELGELINKIRPMQFEFFSNLNYYNSVPLKNKIRIKLNNHTIGKRLNELITAHDQKNEELIQKKNELESAQSELSEMDIESQSKKFAHLIQEYNHNIRILSILTGSGFRKLSPDLRSENPSSLEKFKLNEIVSTLPTCDYDFSEMD